MRKRNVTELKTLKKLLGVSMETAVEIIEKKGPFAFINNGFTIISLGGELKELGAEVEYLRDKPEIINQLQAEAVSKYPKHANDIIIKTFTKVYSAVIFNVSTGLSIAEDWKEYNQGKQEQ